MKKALPLFLALFASFVLSAQNIVITEISYNPPESGTDTTEFIEIFNNGSTMVDLTGYQFTSGVVFTFPNITINAGDYLVIAVDTVALNNRFGHSGALEWTSGGLSNGGEPIALKDNMGNLIDSLRYDDVSPWPIGPPDPDGAGPTIVLCDPNADNTDGANWTISTTPAAQALVNGNQPFGSPGASDANCVPSNPVIASAVVDSNATCNGFLDGGATATGSGGTAPYTFAWSNGATTASITGVAAGTYTVTITDNNGATDSSSVNITEPTMLVAASVVDSNISCNGFIDGGATASATGGTMPYTYLWSNSATSASITGVAAGTYTVSVTDNNGCGPTTSSVTITQPAALVAASVVDSNATANGALDGGATASATGGTMPYTYLWSNSATSASITGVAAGTYTVSVTDNNGCGPATSNVTITQPAAAIANLVITEINYNGPEGGSDTSEFIEFVNVGNTTVQLNNYSFSQGVIYSFTAPDSITAGQYFVIAADSSGFRNRFGFDADAIWTSGGLSNSGEDITIVDDIGRTVDSVDYDDNLPWPTSPDGLGFTLVLCDSTADNNDVLNWDVANTPISGQIINGFQVFANPGVGATCTTPITTATTSTNVSCNGGSDGSASVSVMGGNMPFTYLWSNGDTTSVLTNVSAGQYFVTVTDVTASTAVDSVNITEPTAIMASLIITNTSSSMSSDGAIDATVTGGTPAYTYLWSNGVTTEDIMNLTAGTYTVTITDANGCTLTNSGVVQGPAAIVTTIVGQDVSCNGFADGSATATVTGGTVPYTFNWSSVPSSGNSITGLVAGQYFLTVSDAAGTTAVDSVTINEPAPIVTTLSVTNVSTIGGNDGAITSNVSGGTAPYSYLWSDGSTTANISNLTAGTYTISVTDANGCLSTDMATVIEPGALVDLIITEINYNGPESGTDTSEFIEFYNNGMTTVSLNGYSFVEGVTHTFTTNDSITAGQYFVIAFDSSGFRNRFGINADAIWTSGGLSNGGEDITIVDDFGRTVDSVDFDDAAPWPVNGANIGPDGNGSSLELMNLTSDNNDGVNWVASTLIVPGAVVNGFQVFASPGGPFSVGINENDLSEAQLLVYPNPTAGNLTVELSSLKEQEILQVYSMTGKLVFEEKLRNKRTEINLDKLNDGVYLMRIGTLTQKIIMSK